jgi:hypothetical protein
MMQTGARRSVGIFFGASIICWLLVHPRITQRRVMAAIAGILVTLCVMQGMLEIRNIGLWNAPGYFKERPLHYKTLWVDDNFLRLGQIIYLIPNQYPYVYEKQLIYTLVRPVPRALWPGKPMGVGFDIAKANRAKNVSFSCSIVGEWYLTAGFIAVFFGGWLHGALGACLGRLLAIEGGGGRALMYGIGSMALVAGLRSMPELVLTSYVFLAWLVVSRLLIGSPQSLVQHRGQLGYDS